MADDTVNAVVGAITNGVRWVRQKYREFKVWVADQLIKALEKGWTAALTIAGLMAASVIVGYVWEIMKRNAVYLAVKSFIDTVGSAVKRLAAFMQLDLVIAVINLGILVNEKLYEELAPLYEELGKFAEELELDVSYISTFLEVDRAILQASYSLSNMGWLKASTEYAEGLSTWLGKLRKRLGEYAANPQQIFTDIQKEIAAERIKEANEQIGKIWAAIDKAGEWIESKGEVVLELVEEIDGKVKKLPQQVQEAIEPWWKDAVSRVEKFRDETWAPFWTSYNRFAEGVEDVFLIYGSDIEYLKRQIADPSAWVRSLLAMPKDDQATLKDTLREALGLPTYREAVLASAAAGEPALELLDAIERRARGESVELPEYGATSVGELAALEVERTLTGPILTDKEGIP